jgi:shikimate dehydrogenase
MVARHGAVLGRPVAHSLSPVLHRAAYAALALPWTYDAVECGVDELAAVLAGRDDWAGVSATMPLKHAAVQLADEVRPTAALVGAANTLLPIAGGWAADNTDVDGVVGALLELGVRVRSMHVLGAGGTAQAVLVAASRLGLAEVTVAVRDPARAAAALATAQRAGVRVRIGDLDTPPPPGLVVSTLPPGAADRLAGWPWGPAHALLDVVYRPWPTELARAATAGGAAVIGGAVMLLHQAAAQVALMTGREAPLDAMRAALEMLRA